MIYDYSTVKVYPVEAGGFTIEAPTFEAHTSSSLDDVLRAVPNLMQEKDKGQWETYGSLFLGSTIVFLIRKQASQVLVPQGIFNG